jgi:hypothetical protein
VRECLSGSSLNLPELKVPFALEVLRPTSVMSDVWDPVTSYIVGKNEDPHLNPELPEFWVTLRYQIVFQAKGYGLNLDPESIQVRPEFEGSTGPFQLDTFLNQMKTRSFRIPLKILGPVALREVIFFMGIGPGQEWGFGLFDNREYPISEVHF